MCVISGLVCASGREVCEDGQTGDAPAALPESRTGAARHQPASVRHPEHHRVFTALLPGFTALLIYRRLTADLILLSSNVLGCFPHRNKTTNEISYVSSC